MIFCSLYPIFIIKERKLFLLMTRVEKREKYGEIWDAQKCKMQNRCAVSRIGRVDLLFGLTIVSNHCYTNNSL